MFVLVYDLVKRSLRLWQPQKVQELQYCTYTPQFSTTSYDNLANSSPDITGQQDTAMQKSLCLAHVVPPPRAAKVLPKLLPSALYVGFRQRMLPSKSERVTEMGAHHGQTLCREVQKVVHEQAVDPFQTSNAHQHCKALLIKSGSLLAVETSLDRLCGQHRLPK